MKPYYENQFGKLYHGCCLKVMSVLDNGIDMILCDPPYQVTAAKWDKRIPIDKMWSEYRRLISDKGAVCLFGTEPFSSLQRIEAMDLYKYDLIWKKKRATGFVHAKNRPLNIHENVSVFSKGAVNHEGQSHNRMTYTAPKIGDRIYIKKDANKNSGALFDMRGSKSDLFKGGIREYKGKYPNTILEYSIHNVGLYHPNQKPTELCEFLIKMYTEPDMLVLDNACGSGTTGVACMNTGRKFIMIEKDEKFCEVAAKRLASHRN